MQVLSGHGNQYRCPSATLAPAIQMEGFARRARGTAKALRYPTENERTNDKQDKEWTATMCAAVVDSGECCWLLGYCARRRCCGGQWVVVSTDDE